MLTFIKQNGKTLTFSIGGDVPEITPVSPDAPIACIVDGAEKYLLTLAHFPVPHISGPVTLPRETAQTVAFNLKGLVTKYGPAAAAKAAYKAAKASAPKSTMLANDDEPEEEDLNDD